MHSDSRRTRLAPRASVLIESMRDIGYSLATALSDIVDNSITASAENIELLVDTAGHAPSIAIVDDGWGMSESELLDAMRPGSRSPLSLRDENDLGRFGLGLKTASFSQCRRLSVISRQHGVTSAAIWDLDEVARTDEWYVEVVSQPEQLRWADRLPPNGTLVVWEKLDRLLDDGDDPNRHDIIGQIDEAATHLELVFHRFLSGERGLQRVSIRLNERPLEPYDPFHESHPATQAGPPDFFQLGGAQLCIQAFTLPHHSKVTAEQWRRYAGREGYIKNQGFYVYRQKRLIIHGTWFGLAQQKELTKLARVRIDVSNDMDAQWQIDVKKATARPPAAVRKRLRHLIEGIGASSKRTYTRRGARLTTDDRLPVWQRTQDKGRISYTLNAEHPVFRSFVGTLNTAQEQEFNRLLGMIGATMPIDALFADISSKPEDVAPRELDIDSFSHLVKQTYEALRTGNLSSEEVKLMMSSAAPFSTHWDMARNVIDALEGMVTHE